LIDAESGSQIWADRYDGDLADIFDLQDRITENVVGAIQPSILSAEVERARRKRPESLDAYDLVLRAFPLVWSLDRDQNETARSLLTRALVYDADYPLALSLLAWCHTQRPGYGWTDAPGRDRDEGLRLAQHAASLSHDDPMVLAILGAAHSFAGDFEVAETHLERARSLDPNSAWAWLRSAWLDVYRERTASALGHFARFRRLSPLDPIAYMADVGVGAVHFIDGRYDDAIAWTQRGLSQQPDASWILRHLVTAYAHAGRLDDAKRTCLRLRQSYPDLTLAKVKDTWRLGERTMARIISGLRDAGLPES
jgi:tetratricopeptide (TPR) repeat protein